MACQRRHLVAMKLTGNLTNLTPAGAKEITTALLVAADRDEER